MALAISTITAKWQRPLGVFKTFNQYKGATMRNPQGIATKRIGELLEQRFEYDSELSSLRVWYDHGTRELSRNVCQPTTYMGRRYGRDATLSGLDIAVTLGSKVLLIVEIEERTARPKIILGDIFGVVLADSVMIGKRRYSIKDVELLIAMVTPEKGKIAEKLSRLKRHVNKYIKALRDSGRSRSVRVVSIEPTTQDELVQRIEKRIRRIVNKKLRSCGVSRLRPS